MEIGGKIRRLRLGLGLTQEELADRCELSKGFISQLERDLTSPSIATLVDILECLGSSPRAFFSDQRGDKIVFAQGDMFEKEDGEGQYGHITWLVPNAQKNAMEPILVQLASGGATQPQDPHEGEEFGFVLAGTLFLHLGVEKQRVRTGESFYFVPTATHYLSNAGKSAAKFLWISTPPSF
ncbi:MAG: cupin domain-containing protein [Clostridia bacterium]